MWPGKIFEWSSKPTDIFRDALEKHGSQLETLQVKRCFADIFFLLTLFPYFKNLKTFDFEPDVAKERISLRTTTEHMESLSSLESLRLRFQEAFLDVTDMRPLRELPSLTSLDIDFASFDPRLHPTVAESLASLCMNLPPTLQSLTLDIANLDDAMLHETFWNLLPSTAPQVRALLPRLDKITVTGCNSLYDVHPCQRQLGAVQLAFEHHSIQLVSRAMENIEEDELYAIDHVEPGWSWIQLINRYSGTWHHNIHADDLTYLCPVQCNGPDEDGWIDVQIVSRNNSSRAARTMDNAQFASEQPVWYWEEIQTRREAVGIL
ncbi:hypothetical protein ACN47E_007285 [Coniothyrium glycines]